MVKLSKGVMMNNKYLRYILGFLMLALILFAFLTSQFILFVVSIFFIIIATMEYRKMFKGKNIYVHKFLPELIGIMLAFVFSFSTDISSHHLVTPILLFGIIFSYIITVLRNKKPYMLSSMATIGAILFTFCGLYIIKLTYFYEHISAFYLITVYFIIVLIGDWSALLAGKLLKNTKPLAVEISPDKTIAGAVANLIFSCLTSLLLMIFLEFNVYQCLGFGIVTSIFAQFGDLTISSIKRDLGLKHSGTLFFEYGGILDRMDSFLFSAPAVYYYLFLPTMF